MAGSSMLRTPDYLYHHVSMEQRVSNLETGVHPTLADVDYFDSNLWTQIAPLASGIAIWVTGLVQRIPYWRKRVGMISLRGGVKGGLSAGAWPGWTTDAFGGPDYIPIATLPTPARPGTTMTMLAGLTASPFVTTLEIKTDGKLQVIKAQWDGSGSPGLIFDGVMWIPND